MKVQVILAGSPPNGFECYPLSELARVEQYDSVPSQFSLENDGGVFIHNYQHHSLLSFRQYHMVADIAGVTGRGGRSFVFCLLLSDYTIGPVDYKRFYEWMHKLINDYFINPGKIIKNSNDRLVYISKSINEHSLYLEKIAPEIISSFERNFPPNVCIKIEESIQGQYIVTENYLNKIVPKEINTATNTSDPGTIRKPDVSNPARNHDIILLQQEVDKLKLSAKRKGSIITLLLIALVALTLLSQKSQITDWVKPKDNSQKTAQNTGIPSQKEYVKADTIKLAKGIFENHWRIEEVDELATKEDVIDFIANAIEGDKKSNLVISRKDLTLHNPEFFDSVSTSISNSGIVTTPELLEMIDKKPIIIIK